VILSPEFSCNFVLQSSHDPSINPAHSNQYFFPRQAFLLSAEAGFFTAEGFLGNKGFRGPFGFTVIFHLPFHSLVFLRWLGGPA